MVAQSDTFTTPGGKSVKFTCIKHASIRIEYDGLEIQVDPVGEAVLPATDYSLLPKANIILVTHEHRDHFDREALTMLRTASTAIYTNRAVHRDFRSSIPLANGDSVQYRPDISVRAVPAYNTTPDHLQYHPQGRDNGYILTLDSMRIYIAGDTEDIPEMSELGPIDIAFLPCNQPYTMTPEQLVNAAKAIKPRVLFPYHYSDTPVGRVKLMLTGSGIDVRIRNYQ